MKDRIEKPTTTIKIKGHTRHVPLMSVPGCASSPMARHARALLCSDGNARDDEASGNSDASSSNPYADADLEE